ncbi:MAG: Serine/threonine-protein kinase pkn3 [Myxococcaceae bacterium]|jgi:serine/threonine-protein kinase|nr:Serine/threonine-protein kinase pkn3 [Myxococcaceae bacterium]MEA2752304.1 eukaryotic-like serine/threonine-protein kinase [Myxococcales bacterium]
MYPEGSPGHEALPRGLPQIGQTLGGKYQIVRLLGEGGMAFVYEAAHQRLQQRVAIKVLTPEFARDPELVSRFEREARAVARLRTKHVARVMDVDTTPEGIPYIVMEFLEGRDLDGELQARTSLPLGEAVDYVLQACAGMLEAHGMGIVHRDLKPANLFLADEREGNERVVKVLDFGISKMVGESTRLTGAGAVMGTVMYMSPEQVRAQPNVDTRADIWALGVILYELIAGRPPWEGHSHQIAAAIVTRDPPDVRTFVAVPDGVAAALATMLQRDPARRFAGVRELLAALAPFAPPGSIGAGVAEQVALGQSGSRAMLLKQPQKTIPMSSRPTGLDAAVAAARAAHAQNQALGSQTALSPPPLHMSGHEPPAHSIGAPLSAGGRSRARLVLIFAIAIGLVGAAGVVLILVATFYKTSPVPTPMTAEDAAPAAHSSADLPPTGATSSSEGPVITAAPPSTGTTDRGAGSRESRGTSPALSASSAKKGADAGVSRPTTGPVPAPAPAPQSSNPVHL